jgi:hypothetical protein
MPRFLEIEEITSLRRFDATGNDIAQAALCKSAIPLTQSMARSVPDVAVSVAAAGVR